MRINAKKIHKNGNVFQKLLLWFTITTIYGKLILENEKGKKKLILKRKNLIDDF